MSIAPNGTKTPTLKDVAAKANVSPFTVSVALNGSKSNTRLSESTRKRIEEAAEELGYRPNGLARALRNRQTNIIGLYFGYGHLEPHDPFHAEILTGLQKGCEATQKDLMIHYSFHRYGVEEVFSELVSGKIDGLVLLAAPKDPLVAKVKASGLAVVAMTDAIEGLPSVIVDDESGSCAIAAHLAAKGHKRVMYRTVPGPSDSAERRYNAFKICAESLGMEIFPVTTSDWKGSLSQEEQDLVQRRKEMGITAAVCWGDPSANALLKFCNSHEIRVPDELAIVGFNGIEPSVEPARHLTSVRAYWSEVACRAILNLVDRLEGKPVPMLTVLATDFVIGDTA